MTTTAVPQRSTIPLLILGLAAILITGLVLALVTLNRSGRPPDAPADFQKAAEVDLSTRPYNEETVAQFTLTHSATTTLFLTLERIDTPYLHLSLLTDDGRSLTILRGANFRTDRQGSGVWEHALPPGTYRLRLDAQQSPGILAVYWKHQ